MKKAQSKIVAGFVMSMLLVGWFLLWLSPLITAYQFYYHYPTWRNGFGFVLGVFIWLAPILSVIYLNRK